MQKWPCGRTLRYAKWLKQWSPQPNETGICLSSNSWEFLKAMDHYTHESPTFVCIGLPPSSAPSVPQFRLRRPATHVSARLTRTPLPFSQSTRRDITTPWPISMLSQSEKPPSGLLKTPATLPVLFLPHQPHAKPFPHHATPSTPKSIHDTLNGQALHIGEMQKTGFTFHKSRRALHTGKKQKSNQLRSPAQIECHF